MLAIGKEDTASFLSMARTSPSPKRIEDGITLLGMRLGEYPGKTALGLGAGSHNSPQQYSVAKIIFWKVFRFFFGMVFGFGILGFWLAGSISAPFSGGG